VSDVWDFCPGRMVPRTKPPQAGQTMSMNGWAFTSKPKVPFVKTFAVKLQGLYWYLQPNDLYDATTNPQFNARRLELFYQEHLTWKPFTFPHPHLGNLQVRFAQSLEVPEAIPNSAGLVDGFDVQFIEHNPGF
jgi:hypothetical protein